MGVRSLEGRALPWASRSPRGRGCLLPGPGAELWGGSPYVLRGGDPPSATLPAGPIYLVGPAGPISGNCSEGVVLVVEVLAALLVMGGAAAGLRDALESRARVVGSVVPDDTDLGSCSRDW